MPSAAWQLKKLAERKQVPSFEVVCAMRAVKPDKDVLPTPATHAILRLLKAGEIVYQAGELPETLRVSKIHYEPPKTVCETPFASIFQPSMENGDGARY